MKTEHLPKACRASAVGSKDAEVDETSHKKFQSVVFKVADEPCVAVHTFNPCTQEAEAGVSVRIRGQSGPHREF